MQSIAVLVIFVGMFIITHGVYAEKLRMYKQEATRVEYRFIPRTYLEEQHSNNNLIGMYQSMFENSTPWRDGPSNDSQMMSAPTN